MTRGLTKDERALWDRLRETVKPLSRPRKKPADTASPADAPAAKPVREQHAPKARAAVAKPTEKPKAPGPSLAPFEEKTLRRLARGLVEIDARIDLHGMRQERAHTALAAFLRRQQARVRRSCSSSPARARAESEGRGVLRESVPRWLAGGDLRHLVVGFEEAHRRHGGAGALYVRIRRRRAGARPADDRS